MLWLTSATKRVVRRRMSNGMMLMLRCAESLQRLDRCELVLGCRRQDHHWLELAVQMGHHQFLLLLLLVLHLMLP